MNETKKTPGQELQERLTMKRNNVYDVLGENELITLQNVGKEYKNFLTKGKTERLCVKEAIAMLEKNGFEPFSAYRKPYAAGEKFYYNHKGKALIAGIMGSDDLLGGINMVASHIDSPRMDLKCNPLYEDSGLALLKTHYYGGIKKYQWTTIPLAMCGRVITAKGNAVDISIGLDPNDPVFCVSDLLIHLATDQMMKKATEVVTGESLNVMIGSMPYKDQDLSERIKLNILKILNQKYNITEEDFISAEIEIVPADPARELGLDGSMILGYGHDDRVCSYAALRALLDAKDVKKTCLCVLADKEEIGSMGNTGMQSAFLKDLIEDLADMAGVPVRKVLAASTCLSGDVSAAIDPNYPEVSEKMNSSLVNGGVALIKYTGSRGKAGSSDASAELMGKVRKVFNENGVVFQCAELGKVDQGGGGTVAQYIANMNVETVDCGTPMLNMHAPYEVVAKADLYMTYKGYKAFFEKF